MSKTLSFRFVAPVLMSFFVMSFCDLVGIGVDRIKLDFTLSNTLAQLIPSAVFLWFFVLSVPVGILQDRIVSAALLPDVVQEIIGSPFIDAVPDWKFR